jgi:hypothetical protein
VVKVNNIVLMEGIGQHTTNLLRLDTTVHKRNEDVLRDDEDDQGREGAGDYTTTPLRPAPPATMPGG